MGRMDSVAFTFCRRVAALWDLPIVCREVPVFADPKWKFSMHARFEFRIDVNDDQWRYTFLYKRKGLDLDQLIREINSHIWINIPITAVSLVRESREALHPVGEELPRILHHASSLCHEPSLELKHHGKALHASRGSMVLRWLEERWFSHISIWRYQSSYNRLIEKQFSRRKPTWIITNYLEKGRGDDFHEEHLMAGNIKLFKTTCRFSALVREGIIRAFLENPEDYSEDDIEIQACFEDETWQQLERMALEGLCRLEGRTYIFDKQVPHLCVDLNSGSKDDKWCIYLVQQCC